MRNRGDRQRMSTLTFPLPLLGMVLVLLFLTHDLTMAAEGVLASPAHDGRLAKQASRLPPAGVGLEMVPSWLTTPRNHHPNECGIGQQAVRQARDGLAVARTPLRFVSLETRVPGASEVSARSIDPTWPPGRMRAILQVFRI